MDRLTPESSPPSGAVADAPTLGLLLRKAREARGLSIDDVVHALKFSARQIEAIEADRMDVLPGAVFLRGLVRSYARLLKLDPESLLGLVESSMPLEEPEIRPPENMGNAAPRSGLGDIPPLVALSILLLVAAAVMIGWHYLGAGMPTMQTAVQTARTTLEDFKPHEVVTPEVRQESSSSGADVAVAAQPSPAVEPPVAASADDVQPATPTNTRRLSFDFEGESWIEVKDASGLVILTGIYHSGTQSVAGRPPFEVVVGNAGVVTLRDDGRSVDMKPYTRSEVARLTLE